MTTNLIGRTVTFSVVEPFSYGYEPNPDPLIMQVLGSTIDDGRFNLILKGKVVVKGQSYCIGLASSRHVGEEMPSYIGSKYGWTVNVVFFPQQGEAGCEESILNDQTILDYKRLPRETCLFLAGTLQLTQD